MLKKRKRMIAVLMAILVCLTGFCSYEGVYGIVAPEAKGVATTTAIGWDAARECYYVSEGRKAEGWFVVPEEENLYYFAPPDFKKIIFGYKYNENDQKFYRFATTGIATPYTGFYGKFYYLGGKKVSGFKIINKELYYFSKTTYEMKTKGFMKYKKKLYKFQASGKGKLYSGVHKKYYYAKGVKVKKYKNVIRKMNNGKRYYFKKSGKVFKGSKWMHYKGSRYYFRKGVALTGWKYVGSYKYYFGKNSKLRKNLFKAFGKNWKKKQFKIKVNRQRNCITLYAKDGKKGYTIPSKAFVCSVGKAGTPTITGTFYLNKGQTYRWKKLGSPAMGGYCYGQYCSRIYGSFLFHSILYTKPNNRTMSSMAYNNLGRPASHGCIRLQTGNAKLIYDIARSNKTKVVIYDSKDAGPFGKPKIKRVRAGQRYDPTDPNI